MQIINLTNEEYHSNRTHVSKSWLDRIERSPAHLRAYLDGLEEREESPAMQFGSMFHALVLEPEKIDEYAIPPVCDKRTTKGKEIWQRFLEDYPGKRLISEGDWIKANAMLKNIRGHKLANSLLTKGVPEQSVFYKDESGVDCKARADWLRENFIVDLKTTDDASPRGFAKSIANYRYQVQAVHYQTGFRGESALGQLIKETGEAVTQTKQGEADMPLLKNLNDVGGIVFRYPSGATNRAMTALWDDYQGKDVEVLDYFIWREKDK